MVRLRLIDSNPVILPPARFQFHNGTIKTPYFAMFVNKDNMFQFHNGTIKTPKGGNRTEPAILFQFHNGTIKTQSAVAEYKLNFCFNSIMVRLRLSPNSGRGKARFFVSIP